MQKLIYKIATQVQWDMAVSAGSFVGAPVDLADGFIHFSTAMQLRETAARHFAGQGDLVLVEVDAVLLGEALRFEVSRGGDRFPHLYAELPLSAVKRTWPLPLDDKGVHLFPADIGA